MAGIRSRGLAPVRALGPACALGLVLAAAGCAREGAPDLLRLTAEGPDEFSVLPGKPLEAPPSLALPPPTPGGTSRAEATPLADAAVALGGRPGAVATPPAADAALIASTGAGAQGIRGQLAAEDLERRRGGSPRLLERLFGVSTYDDVYEGQGLDPHAEVDRFRRAGVRTPAAPPPGQ